jgi:OOP family OmpA-OmpF porin
MRKVLFFLFGFFLFNPSLFSQNFLANPGFEAIQSEFEKEYPKDDPSIVPNARGCISCLQSWRINYANTAFGLTEKLPEWNWKYYSNIWLYNNDSFWNDQKTFGKAFAAIKVNCFDPEGKRRPLNPKSDYLQTKLLRPLIKGKRYHVSFQVIPSFYLSLNNIGILFTEKSIRLDTVSFINIPAQIVMEKIPDTSGHYETFEDTFIAEKDYNYLTLGYFPTGKSSQTLYRPHNLSRDFTDMDLTEQNKHPGFWFLIDEIKIAGFFESEKLQKIISNKIECKNIQFETAKSNLTAYGKIEIDKLVKLMKEIPYMKIKIEGHTDDIGENDFNLKLSNQRVNEIHDCLIKSGIEMNRINVQGFGETKPLVPNTSEENRALNRRVEIKVLK